MMEREKHPPGLIALFTTEMWERFGFYLMVGIFYFYLTDSERGGLGWTGTEASALVGTYMALVYFTPFIGGLIADRLLGCRKTIVIGAVLMMTGYFLLAVPDKYVMFVALGIIILGNGAFKPNISTLLGNLYPPGSKLKDAGYNIFYMGINIGAFFCNFVAALVRNYVDKHPLEITSTWTVTGWNAAFATAGFGMLIGLVVFLFNYRGLGRADPDPAANPHTQESLQPLFVQCLGPAVLCGAAGWLIARYVLEIEKPEALITAVFLGACLPVVVFYVLIWRSVPDPADRGRVAALLTIFGVVIIFWATFGLNTTALNDWTNKNTSREPGPIVKPLTDHMKEFAEDAPPSYFKNAGPDVPRPARDTFVVVSEKRYDELKKAKELKKDGKVYVTEKMLEEVYQHANADTPTLEPDKPLKLVNPEVFASINPAFVVLLTPLVVGFFHFLRLRGMEPSTAGKIGLGLLLTAGGPLVMFAATGVTHDGATKGSAGWLFGTYLMTTLGELCLSPMGLSLVNKVSPAHIRAFMMGGWFLSTSIGNKLSGIFGELYQKVDHYKFWPALAGITAFFACVIFLLLPWLNRQMTEREVQPKAPQ
jgi:POT family proton-dependent oligopeptide transporter